MRNHRIAGFSLIELLVVIAIIGILASIAIPIYRNYIRSSHRANAKATLAQAAQNMERYFTRHNSYRDGADPPTVGADATDEVPEFTDGSTYRLSFVDSDGAGGAEPTAVTFRIRATAQGDQASDPCAILELNQAGVRTATDKDGNAVATSCW